MKFSSLNWFFFLEKTYALFFLKHLPFTIRSFVFLNATAEVVILDIFPSSGARCRWQHKKFIHVIFSSSTCFLHKRVDFVKTCHFYDWAELVSASLSTPLSPAGNDETVYIVFWVCSQINNLF